MKKNKFVVFITIGFEFTSLVLIALWVGSYLEKMGYSNMATAFCVLGAFLVWFISLMVKLKNLNKND